MLQQGHVASLIQQLAGMGRDSISAAIFRAAHDLLTVDPEAAPLLLSDAKFLAYILQGMGGKTEALYASATRLIGQVFAGPCPQDLTLRAVQEGYLVKVRELLCATNVCVIKEALWGLGNFAEDNPVSAACFLTDQALLSRVVVLMRNPATELRGEACWAISNALLKADCADARTAFTREGTDLFRGYHANLDGKLATRDVALLENILASVQKLLELDLTFKSEGTQLVAYQAELTELSDVIDTLSGHKHEEVRERAECIVTTYLHCEQSGELEIVNELEANSGNTTLL